MHNSPKKYINKLPLTSKTTGRERRKNLAKEILHNGTPLPLPVVHRDIDEEFKKWVNEELWISYEDVEVPTMVLLASQKLSEFAQMYLNSDDNINIKLNFKTITRDPNPLPGTSHNRLWNIPGERHYLMHREEVLDDNGTTSYIDYKMKQPYCLDFIFKVSIFTNKFDLINLFNEMVNNKFKARQAYIRPNGHCMPMVLDNISDESEYNINDRTFFSQSFTIRAMCYIIHEDDFEVVESPKRILMIFEGESKRKNSVEIEEGPPYCRPELETPYYYKPITITMNLSPCCNISKFTIDTDMLLTGITSENIRNYKIKINGDQLQLPSSDEWLIQVNNGDIITVKINKRIIYENAQLLFNGYDPNTIYDQNLDFPESILDETQPWGDIIIEPQTCSPKPEDPEPECPKIVIENPCGC